MEIQRTYKQKLAAQLQDWSAQINLMQARAEIAAVDRKVKRAKAQHELRLQQRAALEKMTELKKTSGEVWEQGKETAGRIWKELKAGIADAHSSLK